MQQPANKKALVAIDLGAQSCRVSLLRWERGAPDISVVHRFPNGPIAEEQSLRWDIRRIFAGVVEGLRACAASPPEGIASVAVDGWGVDYTRLDAAERIAGAQLFFPWNRKKCPRYKGYLLESRYPLVQLSVLPHPSLTTTLRITR